MKYLFSLIFMLVFSFGVDAQKLIYNSGDTVTNTEVLSLSFENTLKCESIAIEVTNTKLSGTVAGTTYLEASINGTNYQTLDSLVNANVTTNYKLFKLDGCYYPKMRLRSVGSGTMAYRTYGRYYLQR